MTAIVYDHPLSPYAQKVRLMLREKGIPFEARIPDGLGSGTDTGYSAQNPRMEVPALVIDGATLCDSTVILEYLEETHPEPPMMPDGAINRARMRMIEDVFDTNWEAINWGLGEVEFFKRGGEALRPVLEGTSRVELDKLYQWLDRMLGDNPWLTGDRFGWGDISAIPFVNMSVFMGFPPQNLPRVSAWIARALDRPTVAETEAEALVAARQMHQYSGLVDSGLMRRQFRDHRLEWMIRSGGIQVVLDGMKADNIRFTDLAKFADGIPGA